MADMEPVIAVVLASQAGAVVRLFGYDWPVSRSGGGRRYGGTGRHRQEFPAVVEQHDTVAQQAPPLLRMAGHRPCGRAIGRQGVRAPRLMPALLVPRKPSMSRSRWHGCQLNAVHIRSRVLPGERIPAVNQQVDVSDRVISCERYINRTISVSNIDNCPYHLRPNRDSNAGPTG